jgi:hypothetical protein
LICVVVRAVVYRTTEPRLSPDSYSYLNVARQFRGIAVRSDWDDDARKPRNDQGGRPPVYPLVLNGIFAIDRFGPTPPQWLARIQQGRVIDAWHTVFFNQSENLRAVQLSQHLLGLFATCIVYVIVRSWTNRTWLSVATALVAVGLRPAWFTAFEPWVLAEELTAFLLLIWLWTMVRIEDRGNRSLADIATAAGVTTLLILTRPAMILAAAVFLMRVAWLRLRWTAMAAALLPIVLGSGAWMIRNAVTFHFWEISSTLGIAMFTHFTNRPEAVDDPLLRSLTEKHQAERFSAGAIGKELVTTQGFTFPQASALLAKAAVRAAFNEPAWFARSYVFGLKEALTPAERFYFPNQAWGLSQRHVITRMVVMIYFVIQLIGLLGVFARIPSVRVAAATAITSSLTMPILSHLDNTRYAFPVETLMVMAAAAVIARLLPGGSSRDGPQNDASRPGVRSPIT